MLTIERMDVTARLEHPSKALDRARAEADAGDESWQEWVAEHGRGEAIVVRLDVRLEFDDGQQRTIEVGNCGVFLEADSQPPKVERQIAEIVSKDFLILAEELSKLGHPVEPAELSEMYVHVELADDLQERLRAYAAHGRAESKNGSRADAGVSRVQGTA